MAKPRDKRQRREAKRRRATGRKGHRKAEPMSEEDKLRVEEWSQIPAEALHGPCQSSTCTLPRCLDPWATTVKLHNKTYSGLLVMVCYSVASVNDTHERRLRVNGEDIGVVPKGQLFREDPAAYEAASATLRKAVQERYGAGALMAMVEHMAHGSYLYQQHHSRGQA